MRDAAAEPESAEAGACGRAPCHSGTARRESAPRARNRTHTNATKNTATPEARRDTRDALAQPTRTPQSTRLTRRAQRARHARDSHLDTQLSAHTNTHTCDLSLAGSARRGSSLAVRPLARVPNGRPAACYACPPCLKHLHLALSVHAAPIEPTSTARPSELERRLDGHRPSELGEKGLGELLLDRHLSHPGGNDQRCECHLLPSMCHASAMWRAQGQPETLPVPCGGACAEGCASVGDGVPRGPCTTRL